MTSRRQAARDHLGTRRALEPANRTIDRFTQAIEQKVRVRPLVVRARQIDFSGFEFFCHVVHGAAQLADLKIRTVQ